MSTVGVTSSARWFWATVLVLTAVKLLLMPAYRSTDFDVHRNWLAITHSLPLKEWYFEATSQWTLDYPPFFAYFEWSLSQVARHVDSGMLDVKAVTYTSDATVTFQRGSVMATDLVLFTGAWVFVGGSATANPCGDGLKSFLLAVAHAGLLIVDHIHFQYNGMLLGLLVWVCVLAEQQRHLAMAAVAAVLILSKHLFLPLAPLLAIYLLRTHCRAADGGAWPLALDKLGQLVALAVAALAAAFGPFLLQSNGIEQMIQICARLFPLGRGLLHTYWAPNVWALYCGADLVLARVLGLSREVGEVGPSSGIQGDFAPTVLPNISPAVCVVLVMVALAPALRMAWRAPSPAVLLRATVYSTLSVFMLGFHVHEKALLVPTVLLALVSTASSFEAMLYVPLSMVSIHAQLPLLPHIAELPSKVALMVTYTLLTMTLLRSKVSTASFVLWGLGAIVHAVVLCIREVAFPLAASGVLGHTMLTVATRFEFLPLLLTSVTNAALLLPCWHRAWHLVQSAGEEFILEEELCSTTPSGVRQASIRSDSGDMLVAALEPSEPGPSVLSTDDKRKRKKAKSAKKGNAPLKVSFSPEENVLR
jgi:alpha-1,3-glucosyltransferase